MLNKFKAIVEKLGVTSNYTGPVVSTFWRASSAERCPGCGQDKLSRSKNA